MDILQSPGSIPPDADAGGFTPPPADFSTATGPAARIEVAADTPPDSQFLDLPWPPLDDDSLDMMGLGELEEAENWEGIAVDPMLTAPTDSLPVARTRRSSRASCFGSPGVVFDTQSALLTDKKLKISVAERYAAEYFSSAHPMWPFLHRSQWEECWSYWSGDMREAAVGDWRTFFVDMVLAVGGLLVQGLNQDPIHTVASKVTNFPQNRQ